MLKREGERLLCRAQHALRKSEGGSRRRRLPTEAIPELGNREWEKKSGLHLAGFSIRDFPTLQPVGRSITTTT